MAGIVLHMLASLLCLFAPNIAVLGVARGLQGMGAAAAMVVAIAVVGDLFAESVAATVLSRLMLVLGVAPVVAPSLGAAVLLKASWHWVFAALVVMAGALLLLAALALPETLPVSHRRPLKVRSIAATYVELLRDVRFIILVLVAALGMSALFAYIAGASFVLQGRYGLDQQAFALVFGAGAVALIGATQFNVVLLRRFSPQTIVLWALMAASLAGVIFVGLAVGHIGGLLGFVLPVWAILAADGLGHSQRAGRGVVPASRRRGHRGRAARCRSVRARCGGGAAGRRARQQRGRASLGDDSRHGDRSARVTRGRGAGRRNNRRRHRRRRRRARLTFVDGVTPTCRGYSWVRSVGRIVHSPSRPEMFQTVTSRQEGRARGVRPTSRPWGHSPRKPGPTRLRG